MNYRVLGRILGLALVTEAALMVPSMLIGLYHGESILGFSTTIGILLIVGMLLLSFKPKDNKIFAREGFLGVSFSWILLSMFGALPFTIEKMIPDYVGAVFEVASGFTTTGASVLTAVEGCPYGLLFWRSFTNWVGGMGVLVFIMAVLPLADDRSMHIMRAEVPGPVVGKLVPKARQSAMILYEIYVVISILEVVFLMAGGMPLYDALVSPFATAGTGGFGIKNASIAAYPSHYLQTVIAVFMMLFGVNFNVYYFILIGKGAQALKGEEFRAYIGMVIAGTLMIALNILPLYGNSFAEALHQSFFQVSSIISTTGFATADFDKWPEFSRMILMALLISGASAGSTAGGIKVARIVMLFKGLKAEVMRAVKPRRVVTICMDGKRIDASVMRGTYGYVAAFVAICAASMLLVSLDNFDFTTTVTGVLTCIGNVGPGLSMVGPSGNFSAFSDASKLVLSLDMLFGRLEIFPLILMFSPRIWGRRG